MFLSAPIGSFGDISQAPGFKLQTSPFGQDVGGLQLDLYGHASKRRASVLAGTQKCMGLLVAVSGAAFASPSTR